VNVLQKDWCFFICFCNCLIVITNDCTLMDIIRYSMNIFLKPSHNTVN